MTDEEMESEKDCNCCKHYSPMSGVCSRKGERHGCGEPCGEFEWDEIAREMMVRW